MSAFCAAPWASAWPAWPPDLEGPSDGRANLPLVPGRTDCSAAAVVFLAGAAPGHSRVAGGDLHHPAAAGLAAVCVAAGPGCAGHWRLYFVDLFLPVGGLGLGQLGRAASCAGL